MRKGQREYVVSFECGRFVEEMGRFGTYSEAKHYRDHAYMQLVDAFRRRNQPFPNDACVTIR